MLLRFHLGAGGGRDGRFGRRPAADSKRAHQDQRQTAKGLEPQPSLVGVGIVVASAVVMSVLYVSKMRVATRTQSRWLRAEAFESLFCDLQHLTILVGLGLNTLFSWWWADPVSALVLVPLFVKKGLEHLSGDEEGHEGPERRVCFATVVSTVSLPVGLHVAEHSPVMSVAPVVHYACWATRSPLRNEDGTTVPRSGSGFDGEQVDGSFRNPLLRSACPLPGLPRYHPGCYVEPVQQLPYVAISSSNLVCNIVQTPPFTTFNTVWAASPVGASPASQICNAFGSSVCTKDPPYLS